MKNKTWILLWLVLGVGICSGSAFAEQVKALKKIDFDAFALIQKVTILNATDPGLQIKVFETFGGDPAMNGNMIYLYITDNEESGQSFTWDTGLNVNKVASIRLKGKHQLQIQGTEDSGDENTGMSKSAPFSFTIHYMIKDGTLQDGIEVKRDSAGSSKK